MLWRYAGDGGDGGTRFYAAGDVVGEAAKYDAGRCGGAEAANVPADGNVLWECAGPDESA